MRLFTAILPDREFFGALHSAAEELSAMCVQAYSSLPENLHLTLCFIGETTNISAAEEALSAVKSHRFRLELTGAGCFRRPGGELWWAGVRPCPELMAVQAELAGELRGRGFKLEDRAYSPHITLGRKIVRGPEFDQEKLSRLLRGTAMTAERISLMKSERLYGRLTYTEMFSSDLATV